MNKTPPQAGHLPDKHIFPHPLVCLIDKNGRVVWASDDPLDKSGTAGTTIVENVIVADRDRIIDALSRCFFKHETVDYEVMGRGSATSRSERPMMWHVRLLPVQDHGELAGCCVCRPLPEYHAEITDDERTMLKLLCDDNTLKEVATAMFLSESAIDTKIRNLKDKLGVRNISGLVATALMESLV